MKNNQSDIQEIMEQIVKFTQDRDWDQFHNGKDLALALSIEASELNEVFLWKEANSVNIDKVKEELADIMNYAFLIAYKYNLDIKDIILTKLAKNAEKYPELILRMQKEGHLIGNHTYSHIQLTSNNREAFRQELISTNEVLKEITGAEPIFVRPPYGSWDKSFEKELNMFPVLWTIDPMDWCSKSSTNVEKRILSKARENAIILLHDEYASSIEAALFIVDELQSQGYVFVTVEEIMLVS